MKSINRALFLIPSFVAGGAERVLIIIANELAKRNIDCTMIVFDDNSYFYEINERIRLIRLNLPEVKVGGYKKYFRMAGNVRKVRSIIKRINPDVVISFSYITNIIALLACKRTKIKVVISERTDPVRYNKLQRIFMHLLYRRADGFVYQTNVIQRKYAGKYKVRNSVVIYNPITEEQIGVSNKKEKIILSVGRLIPEKNHELLIRAFASAEKLSDYELHIYGDGPLKEKLYDVILQLGMEKRIKLCGVELNSIKIHNDATIFVLPSYVEGFPNALIEAMANGIVCVASDIESGVIREIIQDEENGYLFKNKDINDLQNKLEKASLQSENNYRIIDNAKKVYDTMNVGCIVDKWVTYMEKNI